MDGEGKEDGSRNALDAKELVESPKMMIQSGLEVPDNGEMEEIVKGRREATRNFLESAKSSDEDEATSAVSKNSMGNVLEDRHEVELQRELLEAPPGDQKIDINNSKFSMTKEKQASNTSLVDELIQTLEVLETMKNQRLRLNGTKVFNDPVRGTEETECACDGRDISFERVTASCEIRNTTGDKLTSAVLTNVETNKKCFYTYSIEELLALRFINVEQQQEIWSYIYHHLGPVARELDEISASEQPKKSRKNVDRRQRKKKLKAAVLEVTCSEVPHIDCFLSAGEPVTEDVGKDYEDMGPPGYACSEFINAGEICADVEIDSDEYENSDDEYDSIQRPAFFVQGEPDFESGPPQDGLEYLRRVRWEAMQIPKVKVAKLEESKLKLEQTPYMPSIPDIADCPNHLVPSRHWVDAFLTDFSGLRQALSQIESSNNKPLSATRKILDKEDGAIRLPCKMPLLSVILNLDAVRRAAMLRKHVRVLEDSQSLSRGDLEWAFALFVALDEPVDADTAAAIRCLLRKCASLRALTTEYDDEVVMLNIIITIAGKYFGQSEQ